MSKALRLQSIDELLGPSATALLANQDELEAAVGEAAITVTMNIETTQEAIKCKACGRSSPV